MLDGTHLLILGRIDIELLWTEVTQLRVFFLNGHALLLTLTLIEQVRLKKPFQLHNDHGEIHSLEELRQHLAVEANDTLIECLVILGVVCDDTFEFDEALDIVFNSFVRKSDRSISKDKFAVIVAHSFRLEIQFVRFTSKNFWRGNPPQLCICLQLFLLFIEFHQIFAVVKNSVT